jgi:NAD(P)-dependent dehydrogenase (short-subunit alcohol dehydrogenase family)
MLGEIKDLRDTALDEIGKVMDVNVWANKVLLDVVIGSCTVEQVVAISSGSAFNGSGGWGAYSISKSALNLLVRVYAHEHPEIHFTALAPGLVHSDMLGYVLSLPDDPRYAANGRIRRAARESRTFTPAQAAASVLARLRDLVDQPSGAYVDVRRLS